MKNTTVDDADGGLLLVRKKWWAGFVDGVQVTGWYLAKAKPHGILRKRMKATKNKAHAYALRSMFFTQERDVPASMKGGAS